MFGGIVSIRRPCLLALGIVLTVVIVFGGVFGARACRAPVDISGTTRLTNWLTDLKERDEFAYPAHTLVGTFLNDAGCSPMAVGLQWIKAGAHARTEVEIMAAEQGLFAARSRERQPEMFDAMLCAYVASGFANAQQAAVVHGAEMDCK